MYIKHLPLSKLKPGIKVRAPGGNFSGITIPPDNNWKMIDGYFRVKFLDGSISGNKIITDDYNGYYEIIGYEYKITRLKCLSGKVI